MSVTIKTYTKYEDLLKTTGHNHVAAAILTLADECFVHFPKFAEGIFAVADSLKEVAVAIQEHHPSSDG